MKLDLFKYFTESCAKIDANDSPSYWEGIGNPARSKMVGAISIFKIGL